MPTDTRFWSQVVIQTFTFFMLLIAWLGLVVPVFPGLVVMWLIAAVYAGIEYAAGRMTTLGWILFAAISVLMVVGSFIDNIIIARRMRGRLIPWSSIALAFAAGIIGSFLLTPLLGIVASLLALFAVETARLHDHREGLTSAKVYMIARGWSFLAVFGIGGLILVLWAIWAFI
jgi:uncharacterized protein YqgC (DUF456 family)